MPKKNMDSDQLMEDFEDSSALELAIGANRLVALLQQKNEETAAND